MELKAGFFDFDGTLVDSYLHSLRAHQQIARKIKKRIPDKDSFGRFWGLPFRVHLSKIFPGVSVSRFMRFYQKLGFDKEKIQVLPGAVETILWLKERIDFMGLISSRARASLLEHCQMAGINIKWFKFVQALDDHSASKPDPAVFSNAIAKIEGAGIPRTKAFYIGDTIFDFIAAGKAGLIFFGVLTGPADRGDFIRAGLSAEFILDSIKEFPNLYQQMQKEAR